MTEQQLLRFALVRPPESRLDYLHAILGPFSVEPGTQFQRLVASADTSDAAVATAQAYLATDRYVGRSLRTAPATRAVLRALPELLAMAGRDDHAGLLGALGDLANRWPPGDGAARAAGSVGPVEANLWDGLIAVSVVTSRPAQEVADLTDVLRVHEALARAAGRTDPAGVIAALTASPVLPAWLIPQPVPGSPADRGIRPAGVTDLLLINERLLGYEFAQISFVESVLRGEKKERTFRRLDRTVDSYVLSTEDAEESQRDLQTSTRTDLQTEVNETATRDSSLNFGVSISASYGPFVSVDTSIDASTSTSSETSTSTSESYAQDVVDRSVTRVSQRITTRSVQRVLAETEETSVHGFDNVGGAVDITGYYRWLEQVMQAQVMNYGRRMIMEFMVPRPAALWLAARGAQAMPTLTAVPPVALGGLTPAGVTASTYQDYVARYQVTGVTPPPAEQLYITKTIEMPELEHQRTVGGNDFVVVTKQDFVQIPAGYDADYVWCDHSKASYGTGEESLRVHVANQILNLTTGVHEGEFAASIGPIEIAVFMYDFKAATIDLKLRCNRLAETYAEWQLATYEKIVGAYNAMLDAYNDAVAAYTTAVASAVSAARAAQDGISPDAKRQIERDELKRAALTMLTNRDFSSFDALAEPTATEPLPVMDVAEALAEGQQVRFSEQAFEWINACYLFYPYFWADQDGWYDTLGETDVDPIFQSFLRSGYARLQVPVRPGFEKLVLYYLFTGDLWRGGEAPIIGDPFYLPIVEELAEATGLSLSEAAPYGEPWTYRLPTTLVALDTDVSDILR